MQLVAHRVADLDLVVAHLFLQGEYILAAHCVMHRVGSARRVGLIASDGKDVGYLGAVLGALGHLGGEADLTDEARGDLEDMPGDAVGNGVVAAACAHGFAAGAGKSDDRAIADVADIAEVLAKLVSYNSVKHRPGAIVAEGVGVAYLAAGVELLVGLVVLAEGIPEVAQVHDPLDDIGGQVPAARVQGRAGSNGDSVAPPIVVGKFLCAAGPGEFVPSVAAWLGLWVDRIQWYKHSHCDGYAFAWGQRPGIRYTVAVAVKKSADVAGFEESLAAFRVQECATVGVVARLYAADRHDSGQRAPVVGQIAK